LIFGDRGSELHDALLSDCHIVHGEVKVELLAALRVGPLWRRVVLDGARAWSGPESIAYPSPACEISQPGTADQNAASRSASPLSTVSIFRLATGFVMTSS
jgi:hypothetical protein